MPDETPTLRFTLIDLMAFVAAIATSLWYLRARGYFEGRSTLKNLTYGFHFTLGAFSILAPLTIATIGLRFRRPRPARRELPDQPGMVACSVVVAAMLISLPESCVRVWFDSVVPAWGFLPTAGLLQLVMDDDARILKRLFELAGLLTGRKASFGIIVAWALLLAGGRCRAEPSWIDRTGRVLGVAWIVSVVYSTFNDHG